MCLLESIAISPILKCLSILPNSCTNICWLFFSHWFDTMSLGLDIPPQHGKTHKSLTLLEFAGAIGPSLFKRHCIGRWYKELIASNKCFGVQQILAVCLDTTPSIDSFRHFGRNRTLLQQSIIKSRLGCPRKNHGTTHHGSNKRKQGCSSMSLLECFSTTPGVEMLLFIPDCETDVVTEWICGGLWIDATVGFIVERDAAHELKVFEAF
mmetsp:Transcript_12901/g.18491  ORF Transcript_12901/g.18491 Transcript_12901/m.18491 type:complete len:209 (-) Transcript_12901:350-976(-)